MTPELSDALAELIRVITWVVIIGFIVVMYHWCG